MGGIRAINKRRQDMAFSLEEQLQKKERDLARFIGVYSQRGLILPSTDSKFDAVIVPQNMNAVIKSHDFVAGQYINTKCRPKITPNYYFERIGNTTIGDKGGPWLALEDGADVYIDMFLPSGDWFYCTKIGELVSRLDSYIKYNKIKTTVQTTNHGNRRWYTLGHPVRRDWFADLYTHVKLGDMCSLFISNKHILRKAAP